LDKYEVLIVISRKHTEDAKCMREQQLMCALRLVLLLKAVKNELSSADMYKTS